MDKKFILTVAKAITSLDTEIRLAQSSLDKSKENGLDDKIIKFNQDRLERLESVKKAFDALMED